MSGIVIVDVRTVRFLESVLKDIPNGLYIGAAVVLCIGAFIAYYRKGVNQGTKVILGLLAAEYVVLLLCSTVFYRPFNESVGHDFMPLWSYQAIENGRKDLPLGLFMNVVAFVPVGLLISCATHWRWWQVLLLGLCISLVIEMFQFVLKRGFSEVDDVLHNTLGCLLGIMIIALFKGIWKFCSYLFWPQWGGFQRMRNNGLGY